jgi:hypothetical protein
MFLLLQPSKLLNNFQDNGNINKENETKVILLKNLILNEYYSGGQPCTKLTSAHWLENCRKCRKSFHSTKI